MAIYLFGSRANGYEHANSDWDIAVLLPPKKVIETDIFIAIIKKLAVLLPTSKVDLVSLRAVSLVFRHEIVNSSELLYCRDEDAKDDFECTVLCMYQRFQEERKEILEDYIQDVINQK